MRSAVIASTAAMASTALAQGVAHVVNSCKYDVYMCNTPAQGGGYEQIDKVLSSGGSYSQQFTELSNGMGWSIKLAKQPEYQDNLLQYEYTFHNDGIIWYDLSQVNGNPWDGDWMITASGADCTPKQQAYRYATDDAYGMQSCPASAEITVTLCSGEDQADGAVSSAVAEASSPAETGSAPAPSATYEQSSATEAPATTEAASTEAASSEAPAATSTSSEEEQQGWGGRHWTINNDGFVAKAAEATPSPTTLVTKKLATSTTNQGGYDVTVTDVVTEMATAYVTAGARRHAHHPHQQRNE